MSPFEPIRVVGPVSIESTESDGRGKGMLGSRVVLVSQAIPGDTVMVRVDSQTRGTFGGRVRRVVDPSPHRTTSPCKHEFWCTGCAWIGATGDYEAEMKRGRVVDMATAIGVPVEVIGALRRPSPTLGYRHYAKSEFGSRQGALILGSFVSGTHWVVDNDGCPVLVDELSKTTSAVLRSAIAIGATRDRPETRGLRHVLARRSRATGETLIVVASGRDDASDARAVVQQVTALDPSVTSAWTLAQTKASNTLLDGDLVHVSGKTTITDSLLGIPVQIGPRSFFQANPACAEAMFEVALQLAGVGNRVWDLYSGVGVLAMALATNFAHVSAVESVPEAAALIGANAASARVNVVGLSAKVEDYAAWAPLAGSPDVIVADPPRKGLGLLGVSACTESSAQRLVLLSCDLTAWQRDVGELLRRGFLVTAVEPFDAFPKTAHVETVTCFER